MRQVDLYTSHEALILEYEQALTRTDSITGDWYDCSAHMLWIGERTRDVDGAHMEFFAGVHNPLGCKIGPTVDPDELLAICDKLNPDRIAGRLTLITRMGADVIQERLPKLLLAARDAGHPVVWVCDPMHGNTFSTEDGTKNQAFRRHPCERSAASSPRTAKAEPGPAVFMSNSREMTSPSVSGAETPSRPPTSEAAMKQCATLA